MKVTTYVHIYKWANRKKIIPPAHKTFSRYPGHFKSTETVLHMCSGRNMCKLRLLWNPFLVDIWNAYEKGRHTMVFSLKNCKIYQKKLFYRKPPRDCLWKFRSVWAYQYMKAYSWQKAFIPAFSNNPPSFIPSPFKRLLIPFPNQALNSAASRCFLNIPFS